MLGLPKRLLKQRLTTMATITATMVRELRAETGAAMMDCKKALSDCDGDVQAAKDHLRAQGLKTAAKKADRETSEGRVFAWISDDNKLGALIAVSCETDFVARTDDFEAMLSNLAKHVAETNPSDMDSFYSSAWTGDDATVAEYIQQVIGKLGENIKVTRIQRFSNPAGRIDSYIHHNDKMGALVNVTGGADAEKFAAFTKDLCIHIGFHNPPFMSRDQVSAEDVARERVIFGEKVKDKPADMQEKIIDGMMSKFYAEVILSEQPWVKDDKSTVAKQLKAQVGGGANIEAFARFDIA